MDSLQCPGCGAAVRPKESWCSLCHRDLRPQEPLVSSGKKVSTATNIAGIPRPSSPLAQESIDIAESLGVADSLLTGDEPRKAWPCSCGNEVAFDVDACPECGRAFLGELRGLDAPAISGPSWLGAYLEASRGMRLSIAVLIALLVAVGIPGMLILFG